MTDTSKVGKWKPGQTGNPNGRPRKDRDKVGDAELTKMKKLLDKHSAEAVQKIIAILQSPPSAEMGMKAAAWIVDKKLAVDKEVERRKEKLGVSDERSEEGVDKKPKAPVISFRMTQSDGQTTETQIALDTDEDSE